MPLANTDLNVLISLLESLILISLTFTKANSVLYSNECNVAFLKRVIIGMKTMVSLTISLYFSTNVPNAEISPSCEKNIATQVQLSELHFQSFTALEPLG